MFPSPAAVKLPVRERGVGLKPPVKDSPLVTKAYWPFKLALVYLPTGGGGLTIPLPLQAALQRAPAAASIRRRRFIAHLAALPFALASARKPESSRNPWCCGLRQLARPSALCAPRSRCCHRGPVVRRQCVRYRRDSTRDGWPAKLWHCLGEHPPGRKPSEGAHARPWEECRRRNRILRPCREEKLRGLRYKRGVAAYLAESSAGRGPER